MHQQKTMMVCDINKNHKVIFSATGYYCEVCGRRAVEKVVRKKARVSLDRWRCMECGCLIPKGSHKCRKCGSYDIDMA